jgi:hypothetical protein
LDEPCPSLLDCRDHAVRPWPGKCPDAHCSPRSRTASLPPRPGRSDDDDRAAATYETWLGGTGEELDLCRVRTSRTGGSIRESGAGLAVYRKTNIAELVVATTKEPMEAVAQAIKSADAAKFVEAYGRLTATCNSCHQSTERAFVAIQAPKASSFPDQDFRPTKP